MFLAIKKKKQKTSNNLQQYVSLLLGSQGFIHPKFFFNVEHMFNNKRGSSKY